MPFDRADCVSEINAANNPVQQFVFNNTLPAVPSPDIGRSAITGVGPFPEDATFSNFNAFKIPQLRGIRETGPYFHDNSAKTLEDGLAHYANNFFPPGLVHTAGSSRYGGVHEAAALKYL